MDPKTILQIENFIGAAILTGLLIGLLGLIVLKYRQLGPAAPLHKRDWFLEIFRRGGHRSKEQVDTLAVADCAHYQTWRG
jgi:hypothetical protein